MIILMCSVCGQEVSAKKAQAAEDALGVAVHAEDGGELWATEQHPGLGTGRRLDAVVLFDQVYPRN